ncbi:MAG: phosphoribosylanthranilate isomerase [Pseudomonadota bacterium]
MRVKICCIADRDEARLAVAAGASAIGLVGEMPSGPGILEDEEIREIARAVPPPVAAFLLTSRDKGADIADHARYCLASAVQIVRHIDPAEHEAIAKAVPHVRRIQVLHVRDRAVLDALTEYEPYIHAFLLDSGWPDAETAELGGTGRTHDWDISRDFIARAKVPVFLAGGLVPDNVRRAIDQVGPYGLDVCSGVRTRDHLDAAKLGRFMAQVNAARVG